MAEFRFCLVLVVVVLGVAISNGNQGRSRSVSGVKVFKHNVQPLTTAGTTIAVWSTTTEIRSSTTVHSGVNRKQNRLTTAKQHKTMEAGLNTSVGSNTATNSQRIETCCQQGGTVRLPTSPTVSSHTLTTRSQTLNNWHDTITRPEISFQTETIIQSRPTVRLKPEYGSTSGEQIQRTVQPLAVFSLETTVQPKSVTKFQTSVQFQTSARATIPRYTQGRQKTTDRRNASVSSRTNTQGKTRNQLQTTAQPLSRHRLVICDTYYCSCQTQSVTCDGRNRRNPRYLPRVPPTTRSFRIWYVQLYNLTRVMLRNLSNFNIESIDLAQCNIRRVDSDAFADFLKLKTLLLKDNPIQVTDLRQTFWNISSVLQTIKLSSMQWTVLPKDMFGAFRNRSFVSIDLSNNTLTTFNSSIFAAFLSIYYLNLSNNQIKRLNLSAKAGVNKLNLDWNPLEHVPDFCLQAQYPGTQMAEAVSNNESAFPDLDSLSFADSFFVDIPQHAFRGVCLPHLKKLDISGTKVRKLRSNFISDLPMLATLWLNRMPSLEYYERYAFNSTSLKKLTLENNRVIGKGSMRRPLSSMFRYCPKLEKLTISNTKIDLTAYGLRELLMELRSVRELSLQTNAVGFIPEDLLWRLPKLKKLTFTGNHLTAHGLGHALLNVTSLEVLNLRANRLTVVNETSLPWEFRQNVKVIDLAQNYFTCTCDLLWFRKWLDDVYDNKSVKIINWPSNQYKCRTPLNMRDVLLVDFHPTDESCAIRNPYVVMGIVVGCVLAGLALMAAVCYRYRWYLRFYIYRLRRRRRFRHGGQSHQSAVTLSLSESGVPVFLYDVYLAHSTQDLDWITEELMPLLEDEHGLTVFVEERDMGCGYLADNIAKYMDESARVMLVVSDNYNREGWRQYEFEHILYVAIEQQKDVIVLLLGDVEAGRMTKDMRRMLTRGTFLQWGPSQDARKVFQNGLKVALKTQDVNMQSLC